MERLFSLPCRVQQNVSKISEHPFLEISSGVTTELFFAISTFQRTIKIHNSLKLLMTKDLLLTLFSIYLDSDQAEARRAKVKAARQRREERQAQKRTELLSAYAAEEEQQASK